MRARFIFSVFLCLTLAPAVAAQDNRPDTALSAQNLPPNLPQDNWEICNETSFILRLATAVMRKNVMTPRGWTRVLPGACSGVSAPTNTPRYIYAESDPLHEGGIREWKGEILLCASDTDFEADATIDCALQDLEQRKYLQVDPKELKTTLIEPDNFGTRAADAGLQRLLRDNGFRISRIDGIMGRRTTRTLNNFLKVKELPRSLPKAEKLTALAEAALARQDEVGLTLCNKSAQPIWTALAFRDDGRWESRGWWPVVPEDCRRTFAMSLKAMDAHFYALQEQPMPVIEDDNSAPTQPPDKKLRNVTPKPAQFCIAEAQFSAIGREYCADRGYAVANFRPLPTDTDGVVITLTESDFAATSPTGLRR